MVVITEAPNPAPAAPALGVSADTAEWVAMVLRRYLMQPFVAHERALLTDTELPATLGSGCDQILHTIGHWPMAWLTSELEGLRARIADHARGIIARDELHAEIQDAVSRVTAWLIQDTGHGA